MTHKPYWYTATEIVQIVAEGLDSSHAEAMRWLVEGLDLLRGAARAGDLERCLSIVPPSIEAYTPDLDPEDVDRYNTLIASAIRHRLRIMRDEDLTDLPDPSWVRKEPLERVWFASGVLPGRISRAIREAPMELRRVGIMIPESAIL